MSWENRSVPIFLTAWMMNRVQLLQSFPCYVGVYLCRRDVAVSEQQLHDTQIGAVIEQVRRERMPQGVG